MGKLVPTTYRCLTQRYSARVGLLKTRLGVGLPFDPNQPWPDPPPQFEGIWDMGKREEVQAMLRDEVTLFP